MAYEMKTAEFDELVRIMHSHEGFNEGQLAHTKQRLAELKEREEGALATKNIRVEFYMRPSTTIVECISVIGITPHVPPVGLISLDAVWMAVAETIAKKHGVEFGVNTSNHIAHCRDHYYVNLDYTQRYDGLQQEIDKVVLAENELHRRIEREIQRILG